MRHRLPMFERVSQRLENHVGTLATVESEQGAHSHGFRVFEYGTIAFQQILERIDNADESVELRAFLWRDDDAGTTLGESILNAAERGVSVTIHKDRVAAVYEYAAGSKQSFFHKRKNPAQGLQAWFLSTLFRTPGSTRQRPNPLAEAILEHPNITVNHQRKRFDHSKLFVFDNRYITLGSMGIGDNHLHEWLDVMVELDGREHVTRLRQRISGEIAFDPDRDIDFLVHNRQTAKKRHCPMLEQRLALIEAARESLTIEMAYLGDRRFTTALLRAVRRGIEVTLVTAEVADVLGHLNRATCDVLLRRTGSPSNLRIILIPRMVHSKIVVVDHKIADVGSANFTPLSHGVYDEINLYAVDEGLARELERVIAMHASEGSESARRLVYRRLNSGVERAVVAYQSRKGGRLNRSAMPKDKVLAMKREEREQLREVKKQQRDAARQERALAKRETRGQKRSQRADKKQERTVAKLEQSQQKRGQRLEKRERRLAKKQERLAAKQALREAKQDRGRAERAESKRRARLAKNARIFPRVRGRRGTNEPNDHP